MNQTSHQFAQQLLALKDRPIRMDAKHTVDGLAYGTVGICIGANELVLQTGPECPPPPGYPPCAVSARDASTTEAWRLISDLLVGRSIGSPLWFRAADLAKQFCDSHPMISNQQAAAMILGKVSADLEAKTISLVFNRGADQTPRGQRQHSVVLDDDNFQGEGDVPPDAAVTGRERGIWRAAITLANNICVQESDRINGEDGSLEAVHATADCAKRIKGWLCPEDEQLLEMFAEAGVVDREEEFNPYDHPVSTRSALDNDQVADRWFVGSFKELQDLVGKIKPGYQLVWTTGGDSHFISRIYAGDEVYYSVGMVVNDVTVIKKSLETWEDLEEWLKCWATYDYTVPTVYSTGPVLNADGSRNSPPQMPDDPTGQDEGEPPEPDRPSWSEVDPQ